MKTYIVTMDKKNAGMDTNTMESAYIKAANYADAQKIGRRLARRENMVFVSAKLSK